MRFISGCFFLTVLLFNTLFAQTVTTILPPGSVVDDDILVLPDGSILASGFVDGQTIKITQDTNYVFVDALINSNGLSLDSKGNLYIVDYGGNDIVKIDTAGDRTLFNTNIIRPSGIVKMPDSDTMLVTASTTRRIYKVAPDGSSAEYIFDTKLNGPVGLAYDTADVLYIANFTGGEIFRVEPNDTLTMVCNLPGNTIGFIAHDRGALYATLFDEHRIYRVDPATGSFVKLAGDMAGSVDGDLATAQFDSPNGIAFTPSGDTMYITDFNTKSLRMITGLNPQDTATHIFENHAIDPFRLKLSPNPTYRQVIVEMDRLNPEEQVSIRIYNIAGQLIHSEQLLIADGNGRLRYEMSTPAAAGVYQVEVSASDGYRHFTRQLMVLP